jgi:hypothetical protein
MNPTKNKLNDRKSQMTVLSSVTTHQRQEMLVGKQPLDLTASSLPPIDIVVFQSLKQFSRYDACAAAA